MRLSNSQLCVHDFVGPTNVKKNQQEVLAVVSAGVVTNFQLKMKP